MAACAKREHLENTGWGDLPQSAGLHPSHVPARQAWRRGRSAAGSIFLAALAAGTAHRIATLDPPSPRPAWTVRETCGPAAEAADRRARKAAETGPPASTRRMYSATSGGRCGTQLSPRGPGGAGRPPPPPQPRTFQSAAVHSGSQAESAACRSAAGAGRPAVSDTCRHKSPRSTTSLSSLLGPQALQLHAQPPLAPRSGSSSGAAWQHPLPCLGCDRKSEIAPHTPASPRIQGTGRPPPSSGQWTVGLRPARALKRLAPAAPPGRCGGRCDAPTPAAVKMVQPRRRRMRRDRRARERDSPGRCGSDGDHPVQGGGAAADP
eukprot:scaffold26763_cov116-Isochrysis_galbana.AAC.3